MELPVIQLDERSGAARADSGCALRYDVPLLSLLLLSCDDVAEGNEFILELQRKSAANKEAIQQDAKNAFYMKNYPDWFSAVGKSMVKKPDGTFMVVTDVELADLKSQGKLGVENAKAMGGKVMDVTQKPIMVLKE